MQIGEIVESITDICDSRQWTTHHLEAGNVSRTTEHLESIIANISSKMTFTSPTCDEMDSKDVDDRGPDGSTPLMLASIHDVDTGDNESSFSLRITSSDIEESRENSPELINAGSRH